MDHARQRLRRPHPPHVQRTHFHADVVGTLRPNLSPRPDSDFSFSNWSSHLHQSRLPAWCGLRRSNGDGRPNLLTENHRQRQHLHRENHGQDQSSAQTVLIQWAQRWTLWRRLRLCLRLCGLCLCLRGWRKIIVNGNRSSVIGGGRVAPQVFRGAYRDHIY